MGFLSTPATETASALISEDKRYRYSLVRCWDASKTPLLFIMLNPSTADAEQNDPTIRKCIGFAERARAGSMLAPGTRALCLQVTKEGFPTHPLYIPYTAPLKRYYGRIPYDARYREHKDAGFKCGGI